ncbi:MAG: YjhG/YagF family D-xylonate dehydratase [Pirellulaceae bacterium]|nr:YjhG/YagF family D-xylonate dehydratase [Pirellulaceae bacterium]
MSILNRLFNSTAGLDVPTQGSPQDGVMPLTHEMLSNWSSGDLFGLTQNAGMGWDPAKMMGPQYLLLSTQGGLRAPDGKPIALGFHTGHFEVGLLVEAAAKTIAAADGLPFAAYCSDPCDGRSQGTTGMFDSLPYRNDAAMTMRRMIRSLPTRKGVLGIATCDKGLPAMMMALAGCKEIPSVIVPGGVTLPPANGEDTGKVQTIGARYVHGEITLKEASQAGCRACGSAGGGCQFLGTAATSQVVAEAMGLAIPHSALIPSGQEIWKQMARDSAAVLMDLSKENKFTHPAFNQRAIRNAMAVHAAFGGSTNLLLHIPAIAFSADIDRPTVDDWQTVNRAVPRFVDVLPNGPSNYFTLQVYLAGGVPEVMWHLREQNLIDGSALSVTGANLDTILDQWKHSERRKRMRELLFVKDKVDPDDVIIPPSEAIRRGFTSTVCFPTGNLCPQGSVIKSTAIDRSLVDQQGIYRMTGPAKVFTTERAAIAAIKGRGPDSVVAGDVIILAGRGPMGSGMEETYQLTSALKFIPWGKEVAIVTDARFSGVSTGACIGHVGPEALLGGPIGKVRNGDQIRIEIDCLKLQGSVDFIGDANALMTPEEAQQTLLQRPINSEISPDAQLPDDTRLWAALQSISGGTWGGCVYDVDRIVQKLQN